MCKNVQHRQHMSLISSPVGLSRGPRPTRAAATLAVGEPETGLKAPPKDFPRLRCWLAHGSPPALPVSASSSLHSSMCDGGGRCKQSDVQGICIIYRLTVEQFCDPTNTSELSPKLATPDQTLGVVCSENVAIFGLQLASHLSWVSHAILFRSRIDHRHSGIRG